MAMSQILVNKSLFRTPGKGPASVYVADDRIAQVWPAKRSDGTQVAEAVLYAPTEEDPKATKEVDISETPMQTFTDKDGVEHLKTTTGKDGKEHTMVDTDKIAYFLIKANSDAKCKTQIKNADGKWEDAPSMTAAEVKEASENLRNQSEKHVENVMNDKNTISVTASAESKAVYAKEDKAGNMAYTVNLALGDHERATTFNPIKVERGERGQYEITLDADEEMTVNKYNEESHRFDIPDGKIKASEAVEKYNANKEQYMEAQRKEADEATFGGKGSEEEPKDDGEQFGD